jgi:predicted nucleotidyltransferase component of viral defense system
MVALQEHAVTKSCLKALNHLRQHEFINDFYLAGGTALALQTGHRISTDLDFFSTTRLLPGSERETIRQRLGKTSRFEVVSEQDGMLYSKFFDTDVSFIHQHHPLLEPIVDYNGIQLASPTDIGLMKLAAINSRGTRRDFIDLYCLKNIVTLDKLLELSSVKYSDRPSFQAIAARALAYFEDAEQQPMPRMLSEVQWQDVRMYCEQTALRLTRRLSGLE